ncbi:D-lactaldehyde dehydrogenase [Gymnopilus junonius]|uniref:D-lactaldehyde dehydrogenase n=1 Tax=Gymnopilus junonius TaxID=109634 RepID=A0A9P5NEV6_GYMJU|nr:D-lactaldehyde dehydrogenase [Gymnopilus junonius]
MPVVKPNTASRVLITGGNGYIGVWVIRFLLEQGYVVRAAVRSDDKGRKLTEYFPSHRDKVEWVVVEDITKDGAFDDAVRNVDAIIHMASPVDSSSVEPEELIKPAVQPTSILKSAIEFGIKVKRIVITSSTAAVMGLLKEPPNVFNEENWGDEFVKIVQEQGREAPWMYKYRASKTLAEQTAWKLYNEHKGKIGWELVVINPPLVVGPTLLDVKTPKDLNFSLIIWWTAVSKGIANDAFKASYAYIDVRDVASAHVLALSKEEAAGERIIVSNGVITWQETRNVIQSLRPELYTSGIFPLGNPDSHEAVLFDYDPPKGSTY